MRTAAAAGDTPRRLVMIDADDALAAALENSLEKGPAGHDEVPPEFVRLAPDRESQRAGARPGDALLLVPSRTTPGRTPGDLSESDRALLRRAEAWLDASGCADSPRLILVSSALVHQPSHRQPGHVTEDALPRRPPTQRVARRWLRLEEAVQELAASGNQLIVLRPTPILLENSKDLFGRLLRGRLSAVPAGFDPPLQLLSLEELIEAIRSSLSGELPPGPWHVAPDGVIPLRKALRRAGIHPVPLPTFLLRLLQRLRNETPDAVEALRYPVTVSDAARRHALTERRPHLPAATLDRDASELEHDPFSLDRPYIDRLGKTLFRFLHNRWWRIEWRGLEHIPRHGGAVLVGNHRGHQPWDGVMLLHRLARELGRYPRFLIHPALVKFPFLAPYMSRCGGLNACLENGDWVLRQKELLAIFPEGIRGAFLRYREAHELVTFRPDYVRFALRHRVPIIPTVIVGSAEIFPILGKLDWKWWKRFSEWPTLPITPTFSLLPLPSKWHVRVLKPIHLAEEFGPEAAEDPAVYRRLNAQIRQRIADALLTMQRQRPGKFHGSIFEGPEISPPGDPT